MKIPFLHDWHSVPGVVKPTFLAAHGHEVINPALDDDDFAAAVRTAQAESDRHRPDVIVGSSRGGAVAMNLDAGSTPLVLLCPAWKRWGSIQQAGKPDLREAGRARKRRYPGIPEHRRRRRLGEILPLRGEVSLRACEAIEFSIPNAGFRIQKPLIHKALNSFGIRNP
jgi:hypothetical protein